MYEITIRLRTPDFDADGPRGLQVCVEGSPLQSGVGSFGDDWRALYRLWNKAAQELILSGKGVPKAVRR